MDLEKIESLNEQELNELYDEFNDDGHGVHIGGCGCYSSDLGHMGIGADFSEIPSSCEVLFELRITTYSECVQWCFSNGWTVNGFGYDCFCAWYRGAALSTYGWLSRCRQ